MFSRVRIAIRFFFVGLVVGILLAPRSGEETRRMVRQKADSLLDGILDATSMGAGETAPAPASRSRSRNGSSRSRSKAVEETAEEAAV